MSWNTYMKLINNPYHLATKHDPDGSFCPNGIINKDTLCKMPCFLFDTQYCTCIMYSESQRKAAEEMSLLEDWQLYQHHGEYEEAEKIAKILKEKFNDDMDNDYTTPLKKYHLII